MSNKKYSVILADPPWQFKVWDNKTGHGKSAERHYDTMTIDDICNLPISNLTADNCALFLWCVWPSIFLYPERVMSAWGFTYRSKAWDWLKTTLDGTKFRMGTGYYTRANSEPCLLAVKGSMPVQNRGVLSIISTRQEHSKKPDLQYELIEKLYPDMNYLELFARQKHSEKWDVWGNEVESDIELEVSES